MKYFSIDLNRLSAIRLILFLQCCWVNFTAVGPTLFWFTCPLWGINISKEILWDRFPQLAAIFPGGTWGFNLIVMAFVLPIMFAAMVVYTDQFIRHRRHHLILALRHTSGRIGDLLLGGGSLFLLFLTTSKLLALLVGSSMLSIYWQLLLRFHSLNPLKVVVMVIMGALGGYLAVVVGIIFCTIVLENYSPFPAISRSRQLLQGRWGPLAKTLFGSVVILLPLLGLLGLLISRGVRGLQPLLTHIFSPHAVALVCEEISQDIYRSLIVSLLSVYLVTLYQGLRNQQSA